MQESHGKIHVGRPRDFKTMLNIILDMSLRANLPWIIAVSAKTLCLQQKGGIFLLKNPLPILRSGPRLQAFHAQGRLFHTLTCRRKGEAVKLCFHGLFYSTWHIHPSSPASFTQPHAWALGSHSYLRGLSTSAVVPSPADKLKQNSVNSIDWNVLKANHNERVQQLECSLLAKTCTLKVVVCTPLLLAINDRM